MLCDVFLMAVVTDNVSGVVVDPRIVTFHHHFDIADSVHDSTLSCGEVLLAGYSCDLLDGDREHFNGISLRNVLCLEKRIFQNDRYEKSAKAAEDDHGLFVLLLAGLAVCFFREEYDRQDNEKKQECGHAVASEEVKSYA